MSDILHGVRARILEEERKNLPTVPSELVTTYQRAGGWAGFWAGALGGASVGAQIGIAMGPLGAIAGTVPCAIIGGLLGYFAGEKAGAHFEQTQTVQSASPHSGVSRITTSSTSKSLPEIGVSESIVAEGALQSKPTVTTDEITIICKSCYAAFSGFKELLPVTHCSNCGHLISPDE